MIQSSPPVSDGAYRVLFILILAVAATMRLYRIGVEEMWFDETVAAVAAMGNAGEIIRGVYDARNPPLYFLLLHFWIKVFGITEVAIRSLSAVTGVLLVAGTGIVGTRLFNRSAGLAAAGMAAVAPLGVCYSVEARCYALLAVIALWHVYSVVAIADGNSRGGWIGFVLSGIALGYTHVWGLFLLPAANILFLATPLRKRYWKLFVAQAVIAAAVAPLWFFLTAGTSLQLGGWVADLWRQMTPGRALLDTFAGLGAGGAYSKLVFRLYQPPAPLINYSAIILFVVILVLGATRRLSANSEPGKKFARAGVLIALATPLLIGYIISDAWQPVYLVGRTDFIVAPFFYLLAGAGISRFNPKLMAASFALIILLASYNLIHFYARAPFDARRSTARYIIDNAALENPVVCTGSTCFSLEYYLARYKHARDIIHFPSMEFSVRTGTEPRNMQAEPDVLSKQAARTVKILIKETSEKEKVYITTDRTRFVEVNGYLINAMHLHFNFVGMENEISGVPILVFEKK